MTNLTMTLGFHVYGRGWVKHEVTLQLPTGMEPGRTLFRQSADLLCDWVYEELAKAEPRLVPRKEEPDPKSS